MKESKGERAREFKICVAQELLLVKILFEAKRCVSRLVLKTGTKGRSVTERKGREFQICTAEKQN